MSAREQHKLRDVSAAGPAEVSPRRSKAEELAPLLEAHRGERHIVVIQSFPDPDAISSALAHQMIAGRYQIECDSPTTGSSAITRTSRSSNCSTLRWCALATATT